MKYSIVTGYKDVDTLAHDARISTTHLVEHIMSRFVKADDFTLFRLGIGDRRVSVKIELIDGLYYIKSKEFNFTVCKIEDESQLERSKLRSA